MSEQDAAPPAPRTRQPNGAGSVPRQRKSDQRWYSNVSAPGGKRITVYGKSEAEVIKKRRALFSEMDRGRLATARRQTVAQFLEWYLTHSTRWKASTAYRYEYILRHYVAESSIGTTRLDRLTPADVEGLLDGERTRGLAPSTCNLVRALFVAALNVALDRELIARNPAKQVRPYRVDHEEPEPLSPEECRRWLAATADSRDGALYLLAMTTGLRQGELLALRWAQDVDLEHARLTVHQNLQEVRGDDGKRHLAMLTPKSRRGRRSVPIPSFVVDELRRHRERQEMERDLAGSAWQEHGLVFSSTRGKPIEGGDLRERYYKALNRAGLARLRFHGLRHVYASLLMALGTHPFVMTQLLGHSDTNMSEHYAHILEGSLRAAADQIDAILRDPGAVAGPTTAQIVVGPGAARSSDH